MFTIMHVYRDSYGRTRAARWNMRNYKNLTNAKRLADTVKGAYVCPLGSNDPVYVGAWQ